MKEVLRENRILVFVAAVLLVAALWLTLTPEAQAQGRCRSTYITYYSQGRRITEKVHVCTGWQQPRQFRSARWR